jgi:hypothetical protein
MKRAWIAAGALALLAGSPAAPAFGPDGLLVGKEPPELQTKEWINSDGRTTLADLKGEVVLIESWKTG